MNTVMRKLVLLPVLLLVAPTACAPDTEYLFSCTFSANCNEGINHFTGPVATQTAVLPVNSETTFVWLFDGTEVQVMLQADGSLTYQGTEYEEVPNELDDSWVVDAGEGPFPGDRHLIYPSLSCEKVRQDPCP